MLREREIGQKRGDRFRRLFADETFYLFVWYEPRDVIWGFQLIYKLPERPLLMVTWRPRRGHWNHDALGEGVRGDSEFGTGSDIRPILDEHFDKRTLLARFVDEAAGLEPAVREFALAKLSSHPETWKPCSFCPADRLASQRCERCGLRACETCAAGPLDAVSPCPGKRHWWAARMDY